MVRREAPGHGWQKRQLVGGALCLDFANTVVYPTDEGRRADRLQTVADVRRWARAAGLARPAALWLRPLGEAPAARLVAQARRVRRDVDRLFRAVAAGAEPDPAAFRRLLQHYRSAVADVRLARTPEGIAPAARRGGAAVPLLALIAHSAVALALSPRLNRVKACPNCAWLFIDSSRSGSRRWCDMRVCGNRAKARRHYYRRRPARGRRTESP